MESIKLCCARVDSLIQSIHIETARNINAMDVSFQPGITVVSGKNGCGKTTLLEMIHVLCHGYSFRTRDLKELVSWNSKELLSRAFFLGERESVRALRIDSSGILAKKDTTESRSTSLFFGEIPAIVMQPSDISLVRGGPEERRRWMDEMLCIRSSLNTDLLRRYRRVLLQRNQWLKQNRSGSPTGGEALFSVLTEQYIELAIKIWHARLDLVAEIGDITSDYYKLLAAGADEITVSYRSAVGKEKKTLDLERDFREALEASDDVERLQGITQIGPHKDDFILWSSGYELRSVGSQGQCRSAAISMRFAALDLACKNKCPSILLLDDVFAELDEYRRRAVADLIREKHAQVFIATPRLQDIPFTPDAQIEMG
jgi:DNA replication and repair protein RecF